ncbi:cobalt ABC transporter permease [Pseudoclavibacter sp. RFBJ3]|uniref:energy-coupling factor transporter transmembrane component T n=1 Tax=unclassified Pseudoclavibacter TaxID=2615177 RepID=UPI000CE72CBA|nr:MULTISPECIES: energy-coupling factor transporter transmembrane component T [unclassified Pseudoclavibacter]PPF86618.1 cobalt ABC transporter permease [Pseudoclavibacter sp. RFBJ5]PPF94838.1 cobalt ABC transporter permease [Pseudoclavibacter sp. RFBH5]PPF95350.1 cobalt ABC transporter permease [Pseudoclavibacter sp. RFBJ3]PPG19490.1 cobalt ABC transporter permease [Pseudoclavibacter sp. RFBI4]
MSGAGNALVSRPSVARSRREHLPWLHRRTPLVKIAATLPAIVAMFVVRDAFSPALLILLCALVILSGTRLSARGTLLLIVGVPVVLAVLSVTLGVWVDPTVAAETTSAAPLLAVFELDGTSTIFEIAGRPFTVAAWATGLGTALRLVAIVLLSLVGGIATAGDDFVRSLVQHLRVPYRFGYAAMAAFRFVPRFQSELDVIRAARRVRGIDRGRGPIAWLRSQLDVAIPLLAGALRHADRVALSMDARAFGFASTRTERHVLHTDTGDWVLLPIAWAATTLALIAPSLLS